MAFSIKDEALDRNVREPARVTGRSLTGASRLAIDNELARHQRLHPDEIELGFR